MNLTQEDSLKHLEFFLKKIEEKHDSWRLISIEFQDCEMLYSSLFENLCHRSLQNCFEQTDCRIFWIKPGFIMIFFQGRALPIEKCVEEFFKATEFRGFGRFFDILDLSVHMNMLPPLIERIGKAERHPAKKEATSREASQEDQVGFKIELSPEKILQMSQVRKNRSKKLVLLVEDDPFTQQLVKLALKDQYDIITAETARQTLTYYQRHLPDMVFLDIQLPDGNGINLLSQIRKADPAAYIVMLSSHTQKEKIIECQSLGARGFIGKPFTRQRLMDAMDKFKTLKNKSAEMEEQHGT